MNVLIFNVCSLHLCCLIYDYYNMNTSLSLGEEP